ncbi:Beta-galactosidase 7 [Ancistrocladus abbreviatus]
MASHNLLVLACAYLFLSLSSAVALQVTYDDRALKLDGQRKLILAGAIHYPRSTPEMWPDLMKKAKEGGLNTIESYIFWNLHEPAYRQYNFNGNLDFIRFFKTIQSEGLHAIIRIGPYVCAEWNYGGFPMWLHNMPNMTMRTNHEGYKAEMQTFFNLIVNMVKKENLFASQGGPIILAQVENEYGNIMDKYGEDGKQYIQWCAQLATSQKIAEPWIMCQQKDAPAPMLNTCNGFYCDDFTPNREGVPKMWTENWTGWFKAWGQRDPHRTAEDIAFSVARFFQKGGSLVCYYMYHGGTNFGRTSGGPLLVTSYDYDAPLNEYGGESQPKWGHLKQLHEALFSMENLLLNGEVKTFNFTNQTEATTFTLGGKQSCFISNSDTKEADVTFNQKTYKIPAWSVSILPDCNAEVYNTAKVTTPTSTIEWTAANQEPKTLQWQWKAEDFSHVESKSGQNVVGDYTANKLMDQKAVANDTSDYLWYITNVMINDGDPLLGNFTTLHVNTSGHILHAFVNGGYIGMQFATMGNDTVFIFEKNVQLVKGQNQIALLSATVGFINYGAFFDLVPAGVTGPVTLIASSNNHNVTRDLSTNQWVYKVGMPGELNKFYDVTSTYGKQEWRSDPAIDKKFAWYKATFDTPAGTDPVALDFKGLGKGHAWVNGKSIGRYWPSMLASKDGCPTTCDYVGKYSDSKCLSNCGSPSQRWYHVPRAFLNNKGSNTLVLFEEFGGNPSFVSVQILKQVVAKQS